MVQVPMAVAGWDASEEDIDVCATYAEYILAEDWGLQGTFTACTFAADADTNLCSSPDLLNILHGKYHVL